jgi:hypothetical protein
MGEELSATADAHNEHRPEPNRRATMLCSTRIDSKRLNGSSNVRRVSEPAAMTMRRLVTTASHVNQRTSGRRKSVRIDEG